jgi:hypothetical protein
LPYVDEDKQQSVDDHLYGPQCLDDTGPPAPEDSNPQCTDDSMPEPNPNPMSYVPDEGGAGGSGSSSNDCHPSGPNWLERGVNNAFGTSWGVDDVPPDCGPFPYDPAPQSPVDLDPNGQSVMPPMSMYCYEGPQGFNTHRDWNSMAGEKPSTQCVDELGNDYAVPFPANPPDTYDATTPEEKLQNVLNTKHKQDLKDCEEDKAEEYAQQCKHFYDGLGPPTQPDENPQKELEHNLHNGPYIPPQTTVPVPPVPPELPM